MKARDIMTSPVKTLSPGDTVRDAARLLLGHHISGAPVVDASGRLIGIVSEADLLVKEARPTPREPILTWFGRFLWLERWVSGYRKLRGRTVGAVMTHNVITAGEDDDVQVLASRMARHQVNRIPIVRQGQVIGIVTRADVLKAFLRPDVALAREAEALVQGLLMAGEEVKISVEAGVVTIRGLVASPVRHSLLVERLETIDGVISIDDRELDHLLDERLKTFE